MAAFVSAVPHSLSASRAQQPSLSLRRTSFAPHLSRSRRAIAAPSTAAAPAKRARLPAGQAARMALIAPEVARVAIAVYGVAIGGGGVGAFFKSGSKPSLISGVVAGVVLGGAYVKDSVPLALGTAAALTVVFAIRFAKTKKVMPAGLLGGLSAAAAAFFAAAIYG